MGFTTHEADIIVLCYHTASFLNFCGALFTVSTYIIFKEARNEGTSLVFFLGLSDLTQACSSLLTLGILGVNNVYCQIQAFMVMFGLSASILWGLVIGLYLFLVLYKNMDFEKIQKFKYLFHLFAWGYPFAASTAALAANQYAVDLPSRWSWCWVGGNANLYRMLLYFPDLLVYLSLVILYFVLHLHMARSQNTMAGIICYKMRIYLLTYVLINTCAIINRFQDFFLPGRDVFFMYVLQFSLQPSQGFFNAIAYAWNEPDYKDQWNKLFYKFNKCLPNKPPNEDHTEEKKRLLVNAMVYYVREP